VKDFGAIPKSLTKSRRAHRNDHELLKIQVVVGMGAAIDHIHHRHRKPHRTRTAEVTIKRQTGLLGGSFGHGHGDCQHGIGPKPGFVLCAIQIDQGLVDKRLLAGI